MKRNILRCLMALVVFTLGIWQLYDVAQPIIFNDEYGYWANSSMFLGDDLSSLTSRIPYYSYGYSLMLVPLRLLGRAFGWNYSQLYQGAVVWNACMLVMSFLISTKIAERYFSTVNRFLRDLVCCVVCLYSSNIFYTHITFTETAILFCFWIFLYILMRLTDQPSSMNHMALALIIVYMYTVHQRTIAILITSVIVVVSFNMLGKSRRRHVAAFWGVMTVLLCVHAMIKGTLQSYYYMGNAPTAFGEILRQAFSVKTLLLVLAGVCCIGFLSLIHHKKYKLVSGVTLFGAVVLVVCAGYMLIHGIPVQSEAVDSRIAMNDFSGQWGTIIGVFSIPGLLRLGISMIGKWFYLASASGLLVCWGFRDLIKHFYSVIKDGIKTVRSGIRVEKSREYSSEDIWLFGVALAVIGTFMISSVYKEGFYKNDDLLNGRYNEYLMGILLLYSFVSLIKDKHWIRTLMVSLALYIGAGALCQYIIVELQRTEFELCHSVMLGRVFWNYEVPVGKVWNLMKYVLPLGILFIILVKAWCDRFSKVRLARTVVALLIPIVAWTHLSISLLNHYTIAVNQKQQRSSGEISFTIDTLSRNEEWPIYYFEDTQYFRNAEGFQFKLLDQPITMTTMAATDFEEDAFYIMAPTAAKSEFVQEKCEIIVDNGQFCLLINKDKELMKRWQSP